MLRTCICHALLRPLTTSIINPPPRPNYGKFKPQSIYRSFYCMMLAPVNTNSILAQTTWRRRHDMSRVDN